MDSEAGRVNLPTDFAFAVTETLLRRTNVTFIAFVPSIIQGRKKKFIDKKDSSTFHVVHRSQQDKAKEGEEDASAFVLIPSVVRASLPSTTSVACVYSIL